MGSRKRIQALSMAEGFAAFSVSQSNLGKVKDYIRDQEIHHRRMNFAEEWNALLEKHGITLSRAA